MSDAFNRGAKSQQIEAKAESLAKSAILNRASNQISWVNSAYNDLLSNYAYDKQDEGRDASQICIFYEPRTAIQGQSFKRILFSCTGGEHGAFFSVEKRYWDDTGFTVHSGHGGQFHYGSANSKEDVEAALGWFHSWVSPPEIDNNERLVETRPPAFRTRNLAVISIIILVVVLWKLLFQ